MMTPADFQLFSDALVAAAAADARVLGLVALGSFARRDYSPDAYSDHDFFLITQPGAQEAFRSDLSWLPRHSEILLHFRETAHGLKVVYDQGHLLEFAVFDGEELKLARVNRYRVLLDRERVAERMESVAAATPAALQPVDASRDVFDLGQFLTILLVGLGRHRRGEALSGHAFVRHASLYHLVPLLTRHLDAPRKSLLDNLDPFRRFDLVYPEVGAELQGALLQPLPQACVALVDLSEQRIGSAMTESQRKLAALIRRMALDG